MGGAGGDEVGEEEAVEEDTLGGEDHGFHEPAGFGHFEEGEEVHAFVVGFFQERFDPAVVAAEAADGVEVAKHAADHAGDAGDAFEEDEADEPVAFGHAGAEFLGFGVFGVFGAGGDAGVVFVAGGEVGAPP